MLLNYKKTLFTDGSGMNIVRATRCLNNLYGVVYVYFRTILSGILFIFRCVFSMSKIQCRNIELYKTL